MHIVCKMRELLDHAVANHNFALKLYIDICRSLESRDCPLYSIIASCENMIACIYKVFILVQTYVPFHVY